MVKVKVKRSRYRPGVAQRVGRGIALLFHDRGTRRRWVISGTPRPHFTPGKDPVPILQEAGWAPGPVWTGGKSRPNRDSIPDRPDLSSVPILTELPGPHYFKYLCKIWMRLDADVMRQGLGWEAKSSSASQEIIRILWTPHVHYRV